MKKAIDPIDATVGARVRVERQLRNLSQTELARHLGVTFQQVQKYEKGANRISASRLMMIAELFQLPPSVFFGDAGLQQPSAAETALAQERRAFMASKEAVALNQAFVKITDPGLRAQIIALANAAVAAEQAPSRRASSARDAANEPAVRPMR